MIKSSDEKLMLMDSFARANSFKCYKSMIMELMENNISPEYIQMYIINCQNYITMYDPNNITYAIAPVLPKPF